jgi:hypothetical protein
MGVLKSVRLRDRFLAVDTTARAAFADTHAIRREHSLLAVEFRVKPDNAFRPTPALLLRPLEGRSPPD